MAVAASLNLYPSMPAVTSAWIRILSEPEALLTFAEGFESLASWAAYQVAGLPFGQSARLPSSPGEGFRCRI